MGESGREFSFSSDRCGFGSQHLYFRFEARLADGTSSGGADSRVKSERVGRLTVSESHVRLGDTQVLSE